MKLTAAIFFIVLLNVFCIGSYSKSKYNCMTESRETVRELAGNLQVQYQRRYDITREIVQSIKSENEATRAALYDVAAAQMLSLQPRSYPIDLAKEAEIQDRLAAATHKLLISVGPRINDQRYQDLRSSLEGSENRIHFARAEYNAAIRTYNICLESFPNNIYASAMGFGRLEYFKADSVANTIFNLTVN